MVSDGNGGAIVVWTDCLDVNPADYSAMLVAQRIDASGNKLWCPGGDVGVYVSVQAACHEPDLAADGSGGLLVAWWTGQSDTASAVYGQRLDPSGINLWGASALQVGSSITSLGHPQVAPDEVGGAFIGWDHRLTHIQANGSLDAPGINGIELIPGSEMLNYKLISDGTGRLWPTVVPSGVFAAWSTASGQVVAQRVNAGLRWGSAGLVVSTHGAILGYDLVRDGSGGIILCWVATDGAYPYRYTLRAQRLDVNGSLLWASGGAIVIDSDVVPGSYNAPYYSAPAIATDGAQGAIVAWLDTRNWGAWTPPGSGGNARDLYAQRLDANGTRLWNSSGVLLPPYTTNQVAPGDQNTPHIASDTRQGAIVAYDDRGGWSWDIAGTRVAAGGSRLWSKWVRSDGTSTNNPGLSQHSVQMAFDASGPLPKGAVLVWDETEGGYHRAYAQKVEMDVVPPTNDDCSGAIALAENVYVARGTLNATDDGFSACLGRTRTKGIWYTFTPLFTGKATVDTCPSDFDTNLEIFTGGCSALTSIACNDDSPACSGYWQASVSFSCAAGTTYFIYAGGYNGQSGNLQVRVRAPVLQWQRSGGMLNLSWVTGYTLQSASTPTGAWSDVTEGLGTSGPLTTYSTAMTNAARFFRLR